MKLLSLVVLTAVHSSSLVARADAETIRNDLTTIATCGQNDPRIAADGVRLFVLVAAGIVEPLSETSSPNVYESTSFYFDMEWCRESKGMTLWEKGDGFTYICAAVPGSVKE